MAIVIVDGVKRDYDENNNWRTDYDNMDIPIECFRIPRNRTELLALHERFVKEYGELLVNMAKRPIETMEYIHEDTTEDDLIMG